MKSLTELPRFTDKLSYLYAEHAVVDKHEKAIALHQQSGTTQVPAAALAVLILGPGTKITHAAVRTLAESNCQILWTGEHGVRFYAHGLGGAHHSRNLIRQARLVSNDLTRLQVVIRMYRLRFHGEQIPGDITLQQLRGKEGVRVREAYAAASREYDVPWAGRNYKRNAWDRTDPVNRALSAANAALYGLVQAAILSGGYSPALGFIHTGKQLSFVYDVADLYKAEFTIPIAFQTTADGPTELERRVRMTCRDAFRKHKLMQRILPDISHVLDVKTDLDDEYAHDPARPSTLWNPHRLSIDEPIGKVLRMEAADWLEPEKENDHGGDDTGEGEGLTAG